MSGIWSALGALFGSVWMWLLPLLLGLLGGCTISLRGGGELAFGMSNDNFLFLRHTVDGDKQKKSSESQTSIDQTILDAFLPSPIPEENETEPVSETPES